MLQLTSLSPRRWWRLGLTALIAAGALSVIPWRLVARAAPSTKQVAAPLSPVAEQQLAACEANLREIGRAMAAYQRDHGELPAHLSDLFPKYITDLKRLHCPADRTDGSPRRADDFDDEISPPADLRPVSYAYMMSPVKLHLRFGGLGGPLPRGADDSWRGQMMAMRANYGDRVPVVRCWHHAQTMYEAATHPLVPNLTLDGAVYRSAAAWQIDPGTMAAVIERMEADLAQGAPQFLKRWNLGSIAGQFGFAKPDAALANRARALAATLEGMADRLSPHDQVTHLATDLPAAVGSLYAMAGDTDKAIAAYQQAMDHLDRTVTYYHGGEIAAARLLPALYAAKGQHDKAIRVYERILLKDPQKSDWYIDMAREYEAMGQTGKAVALRQKWDPSGQLLNKPAPELGGSDQDGKSVDLAKLRGRVVVLFFRNSRYPRQDVVMRELDALQRQFGGQGLSVVCLARLVDMAMAAAQAPKNHAYPLLLGADAIYDKYGVQDSSMLYIVDQQGKLVQRYLGYGYDPGEERWLDQTVRKLLAPQMAKRLANLQGAPGPAGNVSLASYPNAAGSSRRQVLVRARVLAINRQRSQELSIDWGAANRTGRVLAISQPFRLGARVVGGSLPSSNPMGAAVRSLGQQNALHLICETNLLLRGRETGGIHIGGEIPVPVPGSRGTNGSAASIAYQPFGILLSVDLQGVNEKGISLRVRPEVSKIDPSRSVSRNGSTVQRLQIQHAERVVSFRSGDSVAIGGGLLQDQVEKNPVLAALWQSRRFQNGESELVILVTPELLTENGERRGA